jgi:hypothetical protein
MSGARDLFERARRVPIAAELARRGAYKLRRSGAELIGACPKCDGTDRFGVSLTKHVFNCRGCGGKGDVIDLVRWLDGCDATEAAASLIGATNRRPQENHHPVVKPRDRTSDKAGTTRALQWWNEARSIHGTVAEQYLQCERGIHVLPPDVDDVLRFHPRVPFGPDYFPSMLALVRNVVTDQPQAVIRTAISTCAEKLDRKALGPTRDGAVKLWANDCVEQGLVIGEGVETVLGAAAMNYRGTLLQPAWSLIDAGHVEHFPVLSGIESLTILVDHDEPDKNGRHAGQHAAQQCAKRWLAVGREVEVLIPTATGADFNDIAKTRTK